MGADAARSLARRRACLRGATGTPTNDTGRGPHTLSSMRHCLGKVKKYGTELLTCWSTAAATVTSATQATNWGSRRRL